MVGCIIDDDASHGSSKDRHVGRSEREAELAIDRDLVIKHRPDEMLDIGKGLFVVVTEELSRGRCSGVVVEVKAREECQ